MINIDNPIEIYDDTARGDSFKVSEILFENDEVILCKVVNEWYEGDKTITIYKKDNSVVAKDFRFYYAKNI